jgi:hypothetical protein
MTEVGTSVIPAAPRSANESVTPSGTVTGALEEAALTNASSMSNAHTKAAKRTFIISPSLSRALLAGDDVHRLPCSDLRY